MPSIIFTQDTNTNIVPPEQYIMSDLKSAFEDAAAIFNKHAEHYPRRWNCTKEATGSAYLNLVVVLYCKMRGLRFGRGMEETLASRDLHSMSRYLHSVATNYFMEEIGLIDREIIQNHVYVVLKKGHFCWDYFTGGLQMLRSYDLLSYEEGEVFFTGDLQNFIEAHDITLSESTGEVELKITRKLQINEEVEVEIPETVESEVINASIDLIKLISSSIDNGYSISTIGCKNEVKILRRGKECGFDTLSNKEISSITNQLEECPKLLRKLLNLGSGNGSV